MTKCAPEIQGEIKVKGQKLGTVTSFKYFGAFFQMIARHKMLLRIAQATVKAAANFER